ncbi:ORF139 [Ranid herpesvirus 2]|uniref:ORF139 n=1 Tax=Ranid herpesvirus 2 TaxID=389214 RepID=Q14VW7_9VIRU|nr:ORF139 [Ranid herpesvirus 2]ABG25621.1 ORF139 [Ranid herpesvirus 2]
MYLFWVCVLTVMWWGVEPQRTYISTYATIGPRLGAYQASVFVNGSLIGYYNCPNLLYASDGLFMSAPYNLNIEDLRQLINSTTYFLDPSKVKAEIELMSECVVDADGVPRVTFNSMYMAKRKAHTLSADNKYWTLKHCKIIYDETDRFSVGSLKKRTPYVTATQTQPDGSYRCMLYNVYPWYPITWSRGLLKDRAMTDKSIYGSRDGTYVTFQTYMKMHDGLRDPGSAGLFLQAEPDMLCVFKLEDVVYRALINRANPNPVEVVKSNKTDRNARPKNGTVKNPGVHMKEAEQMRDRLYGWHLTRLSDTPADPAKIGMLFGGTAVLFTVVASIVLCMVCFKYRECVCPNRREKCPLLFGRKSRFRFLNTEYENVREVKLKA